MINKQLFMLKKRIIDVLYIKGITISIPSLHQQISQLRILLRKLICLYIDLYNNTIRFDLIIGFGFNRFEEYGKINSKLSGRFIHCAENGFCCGTRIHLSAVFHMKQTK